MQMGQATPTDWTGGTGVFPSGGVITVPAEPNRTGIYISNQDTTAANFLITANIGGGTGTEQVDVVLTVAGTGGPTGAGILNLSNLSGLFTNAGFQVSGTAGKKICVLTY